MVDPYVYPGTDILINKEDIRNQDELRAFERAMTLQRLSEPLPDIPLTAEGYRKLHQHIFQDVYDWAGQDRTVDIAKGNSYFCRADYVDRELEKRLAAVRAENSLIGLSAEQFASRAAEHMGEINVIHPFREGNGRTQRAFLEVLGKHAGHEIEPTRIDAAAWHEASVSSFMKADYEPMRQVIITSLVERSPSRSPWDIFIDTAQRQADSERAGEIPEQRVERGRQGRKDDDDDDGSRGII